MKRALLSPRAWLLTLLAAAVLAGMFSLFAPAPAEAQTTTWSARLTVQDRGSPIVGCGSAAGLCSSTTVLTDDDFSHNLVPGVTYTIRSITLNTNTGLLRIDFDNAIPERVARRLTLHVGSVTLPLENGTFDTEFSRRRVEWSNTGLTWTPNQQVSLNLVEPRPYPWMGVVFVSAAFVPCSDPQEVCNELIVPEGGSATFGVRLSEQPTQTVTVNLSKYAHDAIHGNVDAVTVSPTTLTFTSSNYNTLQTVTVTAAADANAGHEHLLLLAKISTTDPIFGRPDGHNFVYVTVSDGAGALQVGAWPNVAREAGNGQTSKASMTVWLNKSSTSPVSVSYATEDGTATAGSDYTAVSGTLTIPSGQTRKTVDVPILDDNVEDSGETFWLVLSNPQGASLEPDYTRALVEIRNDEAHLDGLSAEGAGSAGGPYATLNIGTFSAETTEYTATVPHGTTHARLVPTSADEDLTLRAGSGSDLTRVRSGEKGPAVALTVGDNVLVVKTTAGTGVEKTYAVTVTREASQLPKPELSDFVKQYDANGNGLIDLLEYAQAGQDYGNKVITFEQFTEVKNAWSESRKYADQIAELPNRSPTVQSAFDDITLVGRGDSRQISTSGRFSDPDGHTITMIEAASSAQNVASVAMASDDSSLTVSGGSSGTATITVTAHDGHNGRVSDTFTVTVKAAPTVASAITDISSLVPGTSQEVALTSVFSDADNDTLTLGAASSNDAVATVAVAADYSTLTLTGKAAGTATITVTAQDPDGNQVSDAFDVTVVNRAPAVASAISDATIANEAGAHQVFLSGVFTDADGDDLTVTATSSDETVATASVSADYATLTVSALARGTATITVTADDGAATVEDTFTVTVKAAPTVASAIADVSELAVDATHEVSLSGVFSDADGDSLTVTANSSNDAVATVAVAADYSNLTLTGKGAGTATITVTARDSDGNTVSDAFDVTVIKVNNPPTVASAIADATIVNQSGTHQRSLSGVFTDADSDNLAITAESSSTSVATASVSADYATLTVSAQSRGTANITVTADDGNGGSVEDTFTVTVKAAPVVANAIADVSELEIDATHEVSMSGVFSDADSDALTISATTSDSTVVQVSNAIDPSTGSATAITVIGVAAGTATVTVTARDSDGNSISDAFDVTVPAAQQQAVELPGPVVSLELTASGENSVTVSWQAPATGGAPDGYIVHLRPEDGEKGSGKTKRPKAKNTQVKFNKLQPGQTYQVWARAQNEAGKGERVHATITLPE